ncbi:MAG: hypothetical protein HY013_01050, partial [Candidatus Solibacter usitatus]|nr:hypothetical protein [Candidatus Solibacter usitatus]
AGPDRIVLSPGGRSAALYSAGRNRVQIVTGLPDKAVLDREVDLSELVRPPSLLAINDEGNRVLAAAPDTDSTALYTLESGSPARYLMALGEVSAMAFAPNGTDAAIADRTRGLYRIRAADGAQDRMPAPVDNPTAVAFTDDGARLLAATPDSVVVLDAAGSELMRIPSNREPAGLHRMLGGLVFRLNDLGDEPLWLVDAGASEPRTVFVPFARSSEP